MRNKLVAQRYARALILNIPEAKFELLLADINTLKQAFSKDLEYVKSINSFLFPLGKRLNLAKEVAAKLNNESVWGNLFQILIKKHRFTIIMDILLELENSILESRNQTKVSLKIAHEHSDLIMKDIIKVIKNILKKDVVLDIEIDPEIIGGFIAQTESLLIDGSVKNNLIRLTKVRLKNNK